MYDVSIARLIPIIKLSYCTMRKGREKASAIIFYYTVMKKDGEPPPKKFFFFFLSNWEFFSWNWEKTYFLALGMGPNFGPKIG